MDVLHKQASKNISQISSGNGCTLQASRTICRNISQNCVEMDVQHVQASKIFLKNCMIMDVQCTQASK